MTTTPKSRPIRLEVPGFMRLVIEHIGAGPRGCDMVSVAHYGEQNGDLMRDPEIMFEVAPDAKSGWTWHPVAIQQDYIGSYREAGEVSESSRHLAIITEEERRRNPARCRIAKPDAGRGYALCMRE